ILVRRLSALERVTARVTGGDLDARVETSGTDEIGRLERSFNLMTERLAAARARLERDDAQRRQLLADITHELATPLTSIRGYLETLTNPAVPKTAEEHATFLGDALAETARLDRMIGELFDLARLEARAQPLQPVRLDWSALNRNATRRYEARFREAGLTLRWEGEPREAWIVADGRRMEQVIDNLLGNALRYVPRGGTVTCALEVAGPGPEALHRLTVADDGPGVDPAGLPHLFERFFRADSSRANGGTGLGLAIVREIVAQHGGHAYAAARAPHGVAFVIELPAGA
ncbi:MAG TPA: HAMP domain-containing sensor histidine kinase, partial [Candidatus Acidoferrales bacterium]|nr:HAMP domain-containing sensor histidine kinase [Candidatus Acidoferrales bacterium]